MRQLASALVGRGHAVDVVTTSLVALDRRPPWSTRTAPVDGVTVHYLGTPLRYRWMGITPTIRRRLNQLERPDVIHVLGFRDFVGTLGAAWARRHRVPYLFEGLGMVGPRLRKVALKRALDRTAYRSVIDGASLLIAASTRERDDYVQAGVASLRIAIRPIGFPTPPPVGGRPGPLRRLLALDELAPLLLSAGRVAPGKGIDLLVRSLPGLHETHLAIVGPDELGTAEELARLAVALGVDHRVHITGPWPDGEALAAAYQDADVFALASASESFGMAAAEAAAAGTASVVTDRCGIADLLADRAALVVRYDEQAVSAALGRLFDDRDLRRRLADAGRVLAAEWSWSRVAELQEELYLRVLEND
jgi:glycosyltransferase involved in cell wall biosynthesis